MVIDEKLKNIKKIIISISLILYILSCARHRREILYTLQSLEDYLSLTEHTII